MIAPTRELATYRYLRVGMVALVVLLVASLLTEIVRAGTVLDSISAYYYAPPRPVFVGVLVALAISLVAIKGNTTASDIALSAAGMAAPVIAFVPIAAPAGQSAITLEGMTPARLTEQATAAITNNLTALLATGVIAWLFAAGYVWRAGWSTVRADVGFVLIGSGVAGLVTGGWFLAGRGSFERYAHYAAAIAFFVAITVAMVLEARSYGRSQARHQARSATARHFANRYAIVAAGMVIGAAVVGAWWFLSGSRVGLFVLESVIIVGFAIFWVLQTKELWDETVRDG